MQNVDMLVETTREFLLQIAAILPRLALGLIIMLVGWIIAKAVRFAFEKALRAINFQVLTERSGIDSFLQQGGMRGDTTTLFGLLAYWVVVLAALIIACNSLGLAYVTDLLGRIALFVPRLVVAILILVFGSYFARFASNAVHTHCLDARIPDAELLGRMAQYAIMAFVVMIALSHLEIGGDVVQKTFLIILGGVVFALALAFGLGGKEWAASLLRRWWPHDENREDRDR